MCLWTVPQIPSGTKTTTMSKKIENTAWRAVSANLNASGTNVTTSAPMTGPNIVPWPPNITMNRTSKISSNPNT